MSNSALVSVVIPCWNAESFVGDAIQSALAQAYQNVEVIVIDDGSTDGSLRVIRSFGSSLRWESGPNRGACAARNRGVELAHGEYIQFLDADDILFPDKIERQIRLALQDPRWIVYCDHVASLLDQPGVIERRSMPVRDADPLIMVLMHRTLQTSGPLYRRDWLTAVGGFRHGLRASQEFDLNLRVALSLSRQGGRFVHVPETLFEVRRRRNSISSDTAKAFAPISEFLPEVVAELQAVGELSEKRQFAIASYAARVGRISMRGGEVESGLKLLKLADAIQPAAVDAAYGPWTRCLKNVFGFQSVEKLVHLYRFLRITNHRRSRTSAV